MKPQLIGIAGGTCTGKTTLLRALQEGLGGEISTLSFDEYFIGSDLSNLDDITDFEDPILYNWPKFIKDLELLKSGKSLTIRANSRDSSASGITEKVIEVRPKIVVEGWLIYHDPRSTELFDKKVFIELPDDEIVRRRHGRTRGTKHWDSYGYISTKILPGHHLYVDPQKSKADLVLDGRSSTTELAEQVIEFLSKVS